MYMYHYQFPQKPTELQFFINGVQKLHMQNTLETT